MNNLNNLKKLVLDGGYDAESKQQVADLEARLQRLMAAEKLSANPVIQEYVNYLKAQSDSCTHLLNNKRELTDLERLNLFDKRDLCDHFTKLFTGESIESVEQSIKTLLNVVQT